MVRRGQYLERAVIIPGDPDLEGLYHRGSGRAGVLIAPPLPEKGGTMEGSIIAELAWALTRAGHPTLRFNYRGVGASRGVFDEATCETDAHRALVHLAECADKTWRGQPMGWVGLGRGGRWAASAFRQGHIDTIVWVSPETPDELSMLENLAVEVVVVLPQSVDPDFRAAVVDRVARLEHGRWSVIPRADATFRRGLVTLGKVVAEAFTPRGV